MREAALLLVFRSGCSSSRWTKALQFGQRIQFVAQGVTWERAALHPLLDSFDGDSHRGRKVLLLCELGLCVPPSPKGLSEGGARRIFSGASVEVSSPRVDCGCILTFDCFHVHSPLAAAPPSRPFS